MIRYGHSFKNPLQRQVVTLFRAGLHIVVVFFKTTKSLSVSCTRVLPGFEGGEDGSVRRVSYRYGTPVTPVDVWVTRGPFPTLAPLDEPFRN